MSRLVTLALTVLLTVPRRRPADLWAPHGPDPAAGPAPDLWAPHGPTGRAAH